MQATMMNFPLSLNHLIERAGTIHKNAGCVSLMPDHSEVRHSYAEILARARGLARGLADAGFEKGDRVATLMWNHHAHLETYFGVPMAGGVYHTLNLRLSPQELAFIAKDAGDRYLIVDDVLLPLYRTFAAEAPFEKVFVVRLTGAELEGDLIDYEDLVMEDDPSWSPPTVDEDQAAGLCYTSGTTGQPKGVAYSHRALVLHSFASALPDTIGLSQEDVVLPVVPMFHANAWGLPFTAALVGCTQVHPGPHLDPKSLLDLYQDEKVTVSAGVPTIWMGIQKLLEKDPEGWDLVDGLRMIVGGSAAPASMIRALDGFGLRVVHAWGMTETAPLGSVATLKRHLAQADEETQYAYRAKQGIPAPFVEVRAIGDDGPVPWDGKSPGELQVRGPWVAASYVNAPETGNWTEDGWFRTGDVVSIDEEGYLKIVDRTKDLIKSGGEWISSVDMENALMAHAGIAEAAVIAIPDEKWAERPLAVIVPKEGADPSDEELREHLLGSYPKWALPDGFVRKDALPRGSTGKFLKTALRDELRDWRPGA